MTPRTVREQGLLAPHGDLHLVHREMLHPATVLPGVPGNWSPRVDGNPGAHVDLADADSLLVDGRREHAPGLDVTPGQGLAVDDRISVRGAVPVRGRRDRGGGRVRADRRGMAVQAVATLPLVFLPASPLALWVLVPALFVGFFGHVPAIVAYTVTATSGLHDRDQGLATGLTSLTQQVGLTVGIPLLSAIAGLAPTELAGTRLALGAGAAITLLCAAAVLVALRPSRRRPAGTQLPDDDQLVTV